MTTIGPSRHRARQPAAEPEVSTAATRSGRRLTPPTARDAPRMDDEAGLRKLLDTPGSSAPEAGRRSDPSRSPLAVRLGASAGALVSSALFLSALRAGRRARKSAGPEGQERVLSPRMAERVRELAAALPLALQAALAADLATIQGPAAAHGRALYLKAAAARADSLLGVDPALRDAALATLAAFARRLDGLSRSELRARVTVLDLDSRVSTSAFDAIAWDEKRGVLHPRGDGDARTDNDGLLQRFTGSCGTTTLQMALCEADPVRALVVNDAGLGSVDARDVVARYQAERLAEQGAAALGRRASYDLSRVRNGLGRLKARGELTPRQATALRAHIERSGRLNAGARQALSALRALLDGFPDDAALDELRSDPLRGPEGLTNDEMLASLNAHLSPTTGVRYTYAKAPEGLDQGELVQHLDQLESVLARGLDVPFGITEPGHFMFMSAVRRDGDAREFLVSCGWGGITSWVSEADLVSGRFIATPFDLAYEDKVGYIDAIFLPEVSA